MRNNMNREAQRILTDTRAYGISDAWLARQTGIPRETLSRIRSGNCPRLNGNRVVEILREWDAAPAKPVEHSRSVERARPQQGGNPLAHFSQHLERYGLAPSRPADHSAHAESSRIMDQPRHAERRNIVTSRPAERRGKVNVKTAGFKSNGGGVQPRSVGGASQPLKQYQVGQSFKCSRCGYPQVARSVNCYCLSCEKSYIVK